MLCRPENFSLSNPVSGFTVASRDDLLEKISLKVFGAVPVFAQKDIVLVGGADEKMPKGKTPELAEARAALHAGDAERLHGWWSAAVRQRDFLAKENARLQALLMKASVESEGVGEPPNVGIREAASELCQALAERWFEPGDTEAQTARAVAAHKRLSDLLMEGGGA